VIDADYAREEKTGSILGAGVLGLNLWCDHSNKASNTSVMIDKWDSALLLFDMVVSVLGGR
jgi:hypothetical protein